MGGRKRRHRRTAVPSFRPSVAPPGNRQTQNPNKCTPYLRAISIQIEIISWHGVVHNKTSMDFVSGRRPVSESTPDAISTEYMAHFEVQSTPQSTDQSTLTIHTRVQYSVLTDKNSRRHHMRFIDHSARPAPPHGVGMAPIVLRAPAGLLSKRIPTRKAACSLHAVNRSERVDIDSRRAEGLDSHAELECGAFAKVRKRVSFLGAACRMLGRWCGMRTFCSPEEKSNQDFDVGPATQTPKRKILHCWVGPQTPKGALRAEARPVDVSSAF